MERIIYRITLDTHKNGIQRTLQGFQTADNMSRRIAINLVSGGDTYEMPADHIVAAMYVTTPNATEPSVNNCIIEGNTVIYDVLPITEEGITEMQLKLIATDISGAKRVLISPKFAVEVTESGADDESAEESTTFTSLENALAKAQEVYNSRLERIEIGEDCSFRVYYADGTIYENYSFQDVIYNRIVQLAKSYAVGGTGARSGEDTDNSMYYASVSESASKNAETARKGSEEAYTSSKTVQYEINNSAIEVENNAILAESYTHGGTGKREGEDTDNAQYYMNEAKKAAGGVDEYAREQLKELESSILDTMEEVEANEEEGKIAGALSLKELSQMRMGGLTFVKLTQSEYEALATKDADTIYFTTE